MLRCLLIHTIHQYDEDDHLFDKDPFPAAIQMIKAVYIHNALYRCHRNTIEYHKNMDTTMYAECNEQYST